MGIYIYAGFRTGEKRLSYQPQGEEAQLEFYSTILNYPVSKEDLTVFNEIYQRAHDLEADRDLTFAWWKVLETLPLNMVHGSLASVRVLERRGIELPYDPEDGTGETSDKALMREILTALDLNPDAVDMMDCMYWG